MPHGSLYGDCFALGSTRRGHWGPCYTLTGIVTIIRVWVRRRLLHRNGCRATARGSSAAAARGCRGRRRARASAAPARSSPARPAPARPASPGAPTGPAAPAPAAGPTPTALRGTTCTQHRHLYWSTWQHSRKRERGPVLELEVRIGFLFGADNECSRTLFMFILYIVHMVKELFSLGQLVSIYYLHVIIT